MEKLTEKKKRGKEESSVQCESVTNEKLKISKQRTKGINSKLWFCGQGELNYKHFHCCISMSMFHFYLHFVEFYFNFFGSTKVHHPDEFCVRWMDPLDTNERDGFFFLFLIKMATINEQTKL